MASSDRIPLQDYASRIRELLLPALQQRTETSTKAVVPDLVALLGATITEDVLAPIPLPSFDNSQMDGYACNTAQLQKLINEGQTQVAVSQVIAAGVNPEPLETGTVAAIMTGAAVPTGADAIVPVEQVEPDSFSGGIPDHIILTSVPAPRTFIRATGSDQPVGHVIFAAGHTLTPRSLGAAAALGLRPAELPTELDSVEQETGLPKQYSDGPVVLILSTGSELLDPGSLPPGQTPEIGKIFDANSTLLAATFKDYGCTPITAAPVTDEPQSFLAELQHLLAKHRPAFVISSGGVSAGAFEVVKQVLETHGINFTKVAMQPGGPQGSGQLDLADHSAPLIALPGNPVSSWISVEAFIRPVLVEAGIVGRKGQVLQPRHLITPTLVMEQPTDSTPAFEPSPPALQQLRRAQYDGAGTVRLIAGPSSHLLTALAAANAILSVPVGVDSIHPGDTWPLWTLEDG